MTASIHVIGNIPQTLKRKRVLEAVEETGVSSLLQVLSQDPTFKYAFLSQMTNLAIDFAFERIVKNGEKNA